MNLSGNSCSTAENGTGYGYNDDDVASRIHDFVDSLREEASGRPA